ncbi:heparinase [Burkholderia sp. Bp8963]|uniref:heparinase II/III domain-containing protein n=1 Tax=Burkholderia sp. Bp8963 TaxID=2184547 RepID=UPI000F5A9155|nr:heparinase II/III family protein [Burkholderia sp. Bp8963]RQS67964.1 heparinase [Burkholderia sp. Bp8963]
MNEAWIDQVVLNRGHGVLSGGLSIERKTSVRLSATIGWEPPEKANLLFVITGEQLTEVKAAEIGFIKTTTGYYKYLLPFINGDRIEFEFDAVPEITSFQIRPWNMTTPVVLQDVVLMSDAAVPEFPGAARKVMKKWHALTADGTRPLSANLLVRKSGCGFNCVAHCNRWFESMDDFSLRSQTEAFGRDDIYVETRSGELIPASLQRAKPAFLDVPASLDQYLKSIGDKSRNMIRKAQRLAYEFRDVDPDAFGQDIYEIRTSDPMRQGRPIPEYFHSNPPKYVISRSPVDCGIHTEKFVGIFQGDRLVSYVTLFLFGEIAQINHILCHKEHIANGVMNLNVMHVVDELIKHHRHVKAVNYMYIADPNSGIDTFRRSVGFSPRNFLAYDGVIPALIDGAQQDESADAPVASTAQEKGRKKEKLRLSEWSFVREQIGIDGALEHMTSKIGRPVPVIEAPVPERFVDFVSRGLTNSMAEQPVGAVIGVPFPSRVSEETGHGIAEYLSKRFKGCPVENSGFQDGFKGGAFRALAFFDVAEWSAEFCDGFLVLEKVSETAGASLADAEAAEVQVLSADDFLRSVSPRPSSLDRVRLVTDYHALPPDWLQDGVAQMSFMAGATRIGVTLGARFPWNHTFTLNADRMWYFSLAYVGRLLATWTSRNDESARRMAIDLISDFMEFNASPENRQMVGSIPSADHSASERLKVLLTCHQLLEESEAPELAKLRAPLLREIHLWAEWLADDRNLGVGNHKLMGATSLIYLSALLSDNAGRGYIRIAADRVLALADDSFDRDGLCNENTIGYHNFNLSLYRKLRTVLSSLDMADELRGKIDTLIDRAGGALELCVLPGGTIPPIGDSPRYELGLPSRNGAFCFFESGFAVVKRDDFYFSLVCGGRTEWHKQMDDSSIYLQYKGVDVVIDAGSYSYDQSNPYTRCITSTTGHSGIVPASLDGLPRHEVQSKFGPVSGRIERFEESDDGVRIACSYAVKGCDATYKRYIYVGHADEVVVVDTFDAPESADTVQRFILGPGLEVAAGDGVIRLTAPSFAGAIVHQAVADIYQGQSEDKIRGWSAFEFGKVVPTTGIDLRTGNTEREFSTIIRLADDGSGKCSTAAMNFARRADPFFAAATV